MFKLFTKRKPPETAIKRKKGFVLAYTVIIMAFIMMLVGTLLTSVSYKSGLVVKQSLIFEKKIEAMSLGEEFIANNGTLSSERMSLTDCTVSLDVYYTDEKMLYVHERRSLIVKYGDMVLVLITVNPSENSVIDYQVVGDLWNN